MRHKTKEELLWEKFEERLKAGAGSNAHNMKIVYTLACYVWGWRQEYKTEYFSYYIDRSTYDGLQQTVEELENEIQSGIGDTEAKQAVKDAYSWLECLLAHRIRLTKAEKPRVY